jgi:hypothetical protein
MGVPANERRGCAMDDLAMNPGRYRLPREARAIVYGLGPIFLATLAEEMGQAVFDRYLRDYYQSYKWGISTCDSFRQLVEQHCQCDLSGMFEEWVHRR